MKRVPTILIVEDSESTRALCRDAFGLHGFKVVLRENADGLFSREVSIIAPDIISMDLMMGKDGGATEKDGFEALQELKADPLTHDIPVIVLTSFFEEGKVRRARELGAVDFISSAGQSMQKIPEHYLRYLKDPKRYMPSHPIFRE